MPINDFTFAFSGNISYSDGTIGIIEAYYDSKGGAYSPASAESTADTAQIYYDGDTPSAAGDWWQRMEEFFSSAMASTTTVVGSPVEPTDQKTITDATFHVRGMLAMDDNTSFPISATYDWGGIMANHVTTADQTQWRTDAWEIATADADAVANITAALQTAITAAALAVDPNPGLPAGEFDN
jgi:hypothetical protein